MKKPIRLRTLSWLCVYASLCPALYGLTNCSPPGSSAHQAPPLAWNFPGKNTGVDCHFLLQGIFPTQRSNSCLLHLLCWQACSFTTSATWSFTFSGSDCKESACKRRPGLIPGSGRLPRGENDYPLQYSCLENPMDREAWQAAVHGVAKSWT